MDASTRAVGLAEIGGRTVSSEVPQSDNEAMSDERRKRLLASARAVREEAYAPYSQYRVGAALLTRRGAVFVGCNVENSSYGLTICAERAAACAAVSAGHREFRLLALAAPGGRSPCGACRQFLREFGDLTVLLVDPDQEEGGSVREVRLSQLLPDGFSLG